MPTVVVFGAGRVATPLVRHLLDHAHGVTVATEFPEQAARAIDGHARGRSLAFDVREGAALDRLIADHDLAVSLLPPPCHPIIAGSCVRVRRPMVTTSYVGEAMRALDEPAREAGVLLLNEMGLDPGLDHMSAMSVVHDLEARGGTIRSFRSTCGGLPAPESNDNPWGYKFSWSPRGVFKAAMQGARWLEEGQTVSRQSPEMFDRPEPTRIQAIDLEIYPNRDSLGYRDIYGLDQARTVFRGTLRYPGWSQAMRLMIRAGLLDDSRTIDLKGKSYAGMVRRLIGGSASLRDEVARVAGESNQAEPLEWLEWLGLFSDEPIPLERATPLGVVTELAGRRMAYGEGERDMIVMRHDLEADLAGGREAIASWLLEKGKPAGESAMARLVSLPAAIGARLVLEKRIEETGVVVPVTAAIHRPVLEELTALGIEMRHERRTLSGPRKGRE